MSLPVRIQKTLAGVILPLLASACTIVVNVSFPTEEIESVADEIVGEVRSPDLEPDAESPPDEPPPSSEAPRDAALHLPRATTRLAAFTPAPSPILEMETAPEDEKKKEDPVVEAIKKSLKKRYPKLLTFYDRKVIGEGNDGLISIRDEKDLSLKEKVELKKLHAAENKDRVNLYKRVAQIKGVPDQVAKIQKIFARSWAAEAKEGWLIQDEKGAWKAKEVRKKKSA